MQTAIAVEPVHPACAPLFQWQLMVYGADGQWRQVGLYMRREKALAATMAYQKTNSKLTYVLKQIKPS